MLVVSDGRLRKQNDGRDSQSERQREASNWLGVSYYKQRADIHLFFFEHLNITSVDLDQLNYF